MREQTSEQISLGSIHSRRIYAGCWISGVAGISSNDLVLGRRMHSYVQLLEYWPTRWDWVLFFRLLLGGALWPENSKLPEV